MSVSRPDTATSGCRSADEVQSSVTAAPRSCRDLWPGRPACREGRTTVDAASRSSFRECAALPRCRCVFRWSRRPTSMRRWMPLAADRSAVCRGSRRTRKLSRRRTANSAGDSTLLSDCVWFRDPRNPSLGTAAPRWWRQYGGRYLALSPSERKSRVAPHSAGSSRHGGDGPAPTELADAAQEPNVTPVRRRSGCRSLTAQRATLQRDGMRSVALQLLPRR